MRRDESSYPADSFRIGARDLQRAGNLLRLNDLEGAGFNVQQAVEKYFKGYLLSTGWRLRRVHDLESLLNDIVAHEPSSEKFRRECLKITDYYLAERYPVTAASALSEEEVRDSLETAEKMIRRILDLVRPEGTDGSR